MTMRHRADIDGLRAFAVMPVVLFHAGVPGLDGGFVGVDVFFVISGYLITAILLREMAQGRFDLAGFYERRARRILPALLVVLGFVLVTAPFALLPSEFETLGRQALGALLFVANVVFWREAGYFSTEAEGKPLLHTWSLGVEEQFYIFAPLALWAVIRWAPRAREALVLAALALSFAACVRLTHTRPDAAFYLLPTRAWELLAGSWLAARFSGSALSGRDTRALAAPGPLREALAWLGLALLAAAILLLDEEMPFPGAAAALPVAGAALIVAAAEGTRAGRLLSTRPLVGIGLVSYSLYLWHWPLVVYAHAWGADGPAGVAGVVAASLAAAWLSWRLVERPFRDRARMALRPMAAWCGAGALAVGATALAYDAAGGWPGRIEPRMAAFDAAREDVSPSRGPCHMGASVRDPRSYCVLGGGRPAVAVWGDSHGVEIAQALSERDIAVQSITYSACPPALGYAPSGRPACAAHNATALAHLKGPDAPGTVLLAARHRPGDEAFEAGLRASAEALSAAGKRVVAMGPVPTPGEDVPTRLARGGTRFFAAPGPGAGRVEAIYGGTARVVMPERAFCREGVCDLLSKGAPILFDDHHLSMSGARALAPALASTLR